MDDWSIGGPFCAEGSRKAVGRELEGMFLGCYAVIQLNSEISKDEGSGGNSW